MRKEVMILAQMRHKVGRPAHSILNEESKRQQIDIDVVNRVVAALVERYTQDNCVLEPDLDKLYTAGGRRDFARSMLGSMSAIRRGAKSPVPAVRLRETLGELIRVGRVENPGEPKKMTYVARDTAVPMELEIAWNLERMRTAKNVANFDELDEIFAAVLPDMRGTDSKLGDFAAKQTRQYHDEQVRQSTGRDPGDETTED